MKKAAELYDYQMRCVNDNAAYFTAKEAFEAGAAWLRAALEKKFCGDEPFCSVIDFLEQSFDACDPKKETT